MERGFAIDPCSFSLFLLSLGAMSLLFYAPRSCPFHLSLPFLPSTSALSSNSSLSASPLLAVIHPARRLLPRFLPHVILLLPFLPRTLPPSLLLSPFPLLLRLLLHPVQLHLLLLQLLVTFGRKGGGKDDSVAATAAAATVASGGAQVAVLVLQEEAGGCRAVVDSSQRKDDRGEGATERDGTGREHVLCFDVEVVSCVLFEIGSGKAEGRDGKRGGEVSVHLCELFGRSAWLVIRLVCLLERRYVASRCVKCRLRIRVDSMCRALFSD